MDARFGWLPAFAVLGLSLLACGCATPVVSADKRDLLILVPGIGGDTPICGEASRALRDAGCNDRIEVFGWGYGPLMLYTNISSRSLHEDVEKKLANRLFQWRATHPDARFALIGHSAGCGVVLGTIPRLPADFQFGQVLLIAPAVSPNYDLAPALAHVDELHVFYSGDDRFWLNYGTVLFGGYDRVYGPAAGYLGFNLTKLKPDERSKVILHPYQKRWDNLGNHGDHEGGLKKDFVYQVIAPIIDSAESLHWFAAGTTRSSEANSR